MRVLVLGGAGYIGTVTVSALVDHGHTPIVIDNLSTGNRKSVPDSVRFYAADIGDKDFINQLLGSESIDVVMHFAAKVRVDESISHPGLYYENNLAGTLAVLDAMVRHRVKNIIFSSSAAVYGEAQYLPIDENHPTNPVNPYGSSKKMAETILQDFHHAHGLHFVILRYFNAAGASLDGKLGENQIVKQNLIPIILENLEKGRVTTVNGTDWDTVDGSCVRDYVHIEDIVRAHILAMEFLMKKGGAEIINLGSGQGVSVWEVVRAITQVHGREVPIEVGPRRKGDVPQLISSRAKAKDLLGWVPEHSNIDTIARSAHLWHFSNR